MHMSIGIEKINDTRWSVTIWGVSVVEIYKEFHSYGKAVDWLNEYLRRWSK